MKKLFYLLGICFCSFLFSCNQENTSFSDVNTHSSINRSIKSISDSINHFNDYYFEENTQTRSVIGNIISAYITKVVIADAIAAVKTWIGLKKGDAAKNATTASANAAIKGIVKVIESIRDALISPNSTNSGPLNINQLLVDTIPSDSIRLTSLFNNTVIPYLDYLGEYHNEIIQELFDNHSYYNFWDTLSVSNIHSLTIQTSSYLAFKTTFYNYTIPTDTLTSDEAYFIASFGKIINNDMDVYSYLEEIIDDDRDLEPYSSIFSSYIYGINQYINGNSTLSTFRSYSNQVLNTIYNNNYLSDLQKEALCSGIVVGYASTLLWSKSFFEHTWNGGGSLN